MALLVLPNTIDAGTEITAVEHQSNYVAIRDAINGDLEGGAGNNLKVNGVTARELADALLVRGMPAQSTQEGVIASGDAKVTPGAGLVLNYASGVAWVTDDSGVLAMGALIPVVITGASVTVAANASGNPRIDQIIVTMNGHSTGTVSVLQGTASVGATLDNRTGAAALPSDAIRLADVLMPNAFAGPFVQTTHLRDRRPWARGAFSRKVAPTGADYTTVAAISGSNDVDATNLKPRIELSGQPVIVEFIGRAWNTTASGQVSFYISLDGVAQNVLSRHGSVAATNGPAGVLARDVLFPSAGSHVISVTWGTTGGTATLSRAAANDVPMLVISEFIRQDSDNSGA